MAKNWSTPKSSLPPHMRPSSRVTPTLALSEGPLTPSPILKPSMHYDGNAPVYRMNIEAPLCKGTETTEEPNVELIKLQCQMEKLTQLVQDGLSVDTMLRSKALIPNECMSSGNQEYGDQILSHAGYHRKISNLEEENSGLQEIVRDSKQQFEHLQIQIQDLKDNFQSECSEWQVKVGSLQKTLAEEQGRVRELTRNNEKIQMAKANLETYLKALPSVDEFERTKAELTEKTESCRRLNLQIDTLEQKLLQSRESERNSAEECRNTKGWLENLRLKVEDLESKNIAHQKRLTKASNSDSIDVEVLLHERDECANENNTLKQYILVTHKTTTKDIEQKNDALHEMSSTVATYEKSINEIKEALACEKDTSMNLRRQLTTNIGRQSAARKRIESLGEELLSAKHASEISEDVQLLQTKTHLEMVKCVDEMKQLMCVSKQMVNGEDLDVSMLLGIHSSGINRQETLPSLIHFSSSKMVTNTDQTIGNSQRPLMSTNEDRIKELRDILKSIQHIRKQVSELRQILSERYADAIADNVSNCSTQ